MEEPKTVAEVYEHNQRVIDSNGGVPRLDYRLRSCILARDPEAGMVLHGGLGALGVGQMWCRETEDDKNDPGYADAPISKYEPR